MARETRPEAIPVVRDVPPPKVIARLAEEILPTLIARLDRSRLGELEVRQDGWRIRLRRAVAPVDAGEAQPAPGASRRSERRADRQSTDRPDGHSEGRPPTLRSTDRGTIAVTSPAVGYYLPRDGMAIGSTLRAGDLLGHVDVLGVRQDVVVPEDGLLAAVEAESGEAVEYGQSLARLELQERRS